MLPTKAGQNCASSAAKNQAKSRPPADARRPISSDAPSKPRRSTPCSSSSSSRLKRSPTARYAVSRPLNSAAIAAKSCARPAVSVMPCTAIAKSIRKIRQIPRRAAGSCATARARAEACRQRPALRAKIQYAAVARCRAASPLRATRTARWAPRGGVPAAARSHPRGAAHTPHNSPTAAPPTISILSKRHQTTATEVGELRGSNPYSLEPQSSALPLS